jgi:hypothetical protein
VLTASPAYRLAIPQSHHRISRFTARTPDGTLLAENIPIGGGSVRAQLQSRVTRTASFTASDEWFPVLTSDPLSPAQAIVTIEAGIAYPTGEPEMFEIFTGRVYNARRARNGQVTFRADDLAADVVAADFEQPVNSQFGASTVAEIERLILDGYEWATFGDHQVTDTTVPRLSWDDDRGKALDDLATALEGRWFALGNGDFVVRQYAYTDPDPVLWITDGPTGTLTGAETEVTADGAYNSVVVLAERLDGGDPIRVVERNELTSSPYRYGGNFNKRVKKVRVQTALTFADAQRVARSQLAAASALTRQWQLTMSPDMTLEPADVIGVGWRGVRDVQIIDSITYPLSPQNAMVVNGRSSVTA